MIRPRSAPCRRLLAGLAGLAVLALVSGCTSIEPLPEPSAGSAEDADDDLVRLGLRPGLRIHRRTPAGIEPLLDGARARQGDLVQLSYRAAGNRHGVVLSLDGRGVVTLHHPTQASQEAALVAHGEHALDHAYELDDAGSYERFVLVTSGDEPLDPEAVLDAARALAERGETARHSPLPLPARWQQSSITLDKQP